MYFALMSHWTNGVDTFNVKIHGVVLSPTCFSIPCLPVVKTILFSLVRFGWSTSGTFPRINLRGKKPSRYVAARVLTVNCRCDNLNKLTLWGTRGVWMPPLPPPPRSHKVFLSFFLEDKTSVPEVFSSCSFIPHTHFEVSFMMVSCYGYEIWRHK